MKKLKLAVEMVPDPLHQKNVRTAVSRKVWDLIRKRVYQSAAYTCQLCGNDSGKVEAHEIWHYDDRKHIQTLVGLIALCKSCHALKHIGFSMYTETGQSIFSRDKLIKHFCRVNGVRKERFFSHENDSMILHDERGAHEWTQDMSLLTDIKKSFKEGTDMPLRKAKK